MPLPALLKLSVENFRSLQKVEVDLGRLNVLVGPNGAGKTNLLKVIEFLGTAAREDLPQAVRKFGGLKRICFRGTMLDDARIRIRVTARSTTYASSASPDEYALSLRLRLKIRVGKNFRLTSPLVSRSERFAFKRIKGRRRITVKGSSVEIDDPDTPLWRMPELLRRDSLGLSTLPRLAPKRGGQEVGRLADIFSTFRLMDINVDAARQPSDLAESSRLRSDASNLAGFLFYLSQEPESFERFQEDIRAFIPGVKALHLRPVGGTTESVVIELEEEALQGQTPLADASFGTVRIIALLAMLHDPNPPRLTCVEEIENGLHPYMFDRLVERLREASKRTQLIIATHSPALVNRLSPDELIVCERDSETGASRIPAIRREDVARMLKKVGGIMRLGELWFSGSLGGVPHE